MSPLKRLFRSIFESPLLWGGAASAAFYFPLHSGRLNSPFLMRYFAGHAVEHIATTLFFIGLAALAIKWNRLAAQSKRLGVALFDRAAPGSQPVADCTDMLGRLAKQPTAMHDGYLVRRLREALEYVQRKGTADTLDDELRTLADVDAQRMHTSYALVRIVVWAIPILGLLGTVIGITAAVANLSPQLLESSITKVTAGLGVAFDHTALALGLSMGLMFAQYFVERYETQLLSEVDARVSAELVGRFASTSLPAATHSPESQRLLEGMTAIADALIKRQAQVWQATIDAAHARWNQLSGATGQQLESALTQALKTHAGVITESEQAVAEQNRRHWSQVQQALLKNAEVVALQQRELSKQGEIFARVLAATGDVAKLETELNRNLSALSGAKNFEQTVISLSAAIHLLNGRLLQMPAEGPRVELTSNRASGKAA